jgi:hypothetical protein
MENTRGQEQGIEICKSLRTWVTSILPKIEKKFERLLKSETPVCLTLLSEERNRKHINASEAAIVVRRGSVTVIPNPKEPSTVAHLQIHQIRLSY